MHIHCLVNIPLIMLSNAFQCPNFLQNLLTLFALNITNRFFFSLPVSKQYSGNFNILQQIKNILSKPSDIWPVLDLHSIKFSMDWRHGSFSHSVRLRYQNFWFCSQGKPMNHLQRHRPETKIHTVSLKVLNVMEHYSFCLLRNPFLCPWLFHYIDNNLFLANGLKWNEQ